MMMPNKEWSDQNGSVFYKQQFIELSTKAKTIAEQGFNLVSLLELNPIILGDVWQRNANSINQCTRLGVINGATVRIEKRRIAIADTYPPHQ